MLFTFKTRVLIALFLFFIGNTQAQDNKNWFSENIQFSGYIKYLNASSFQDMNAMSNDNILHNRLNFKAYLNSHFSFDAEVRNRVFWGTSIQSIPNYAVFLKANDYRIDMAVDIIDKPALLFHVNVDRLYLDYQLESWQFRLGRQRVNWGKTFVWNTNDLFNTYSFFDYDYEERPGVDALSIQYFTSGDSSIEFVTDYTDKWAENTTAIKYNFHSFNYDFQTILAKYQEDYYMGFGWEGSIKDMGFKGEISYFIPSDNMDNSSVVFVGTWALDYYFKNGLTANVGYLYSGNGIREIKDFELDAFNVFKQSAKDLMPNRNSFFIQLSKPFTPALNSTMAAIYAYELQGLYFVPQTSYTIADNWEVDLVGQFFYGKQDKSINNILNTITLRFRWSF